MLVVIVIIYNDKKIFQELSTKTKGADLIVRGKQRSKPNDGNSSLSNKFEQRFSLPYGVDPEKISSELSNKGILTVRAPKEAVTGVFPRSQEVIENKIRHCDMKNYSKGLPEPEVKYKKDKIQITINTQEYR